MGRRLVAPPGAGRLRRLALALLGASQLGGGLAIAPAIAQALPQASPALPAPPPPVSECVRRFGSTGCAARLYAQLLCEIVGSNVDLKPLGAQLQQRFGEEQINFSGISVEQVEVAAVRYYAPQLCPAKARQIWRVMVPGEAG